MHICILSLPGIPRNLPYLGGVQTHTQNLIALLLNEGHRVSLITAAGERTRDKNLEVIPVGGASRGSANGQWFERAGREFMRLCKGNEVDFVFSESGAVRNLLGLCRKLGVPVVVFVHNISLNYFYNTWQEVDGLRALKSYVLRSLPRIVSDMWVKDMAFLRMPERVVAGSEGIARQLRVYYRVPREKVGVIHNWVETERFNRDRAAGADVRRMLGLPHDSIVILFVGSLWRPKGIRVTIRAFNDFIREGCKAYLVIVGDGPDRVYLERYMANHQALQQWVRLLGGYPNENLPPLYSAADIFLMPSQLYEVLPYTTIEAMSCELPVIASDIPANREALGERGVFFPKGDEEALTEKLRDFVENLEGHKDKGAQNRRSVEEKFSSDSAARKMRKLLTEVRREYERDRKAG